MFGGPVRVPAEAGEGMARVRISFPSAEGRDVRTREVEIPVREPPAADVAPATGVARPRDPSRAVSTVAPAQLVEQRAPTVVSLKYVYRGSGREWPRDAQGTVVDPSGLVLLSNSYFSWSGGQVAGIKVLFGSDPKEWEAVIVARDSILDLAYVQVLELGDQRVAAVDLSQGGEVQVGADLTSVWRDRRGF